MNINIILSDAVASEIQYTLDNNLPLDIDGPSFTSPTTVTEVIQKLVDFNTEKYIRRINLKKDNEILNAVKSDPTLKLQVDTAISGSKPPKPPK